MNTSVLDKRKSGRKKLDGILKRLTRIGRKSEITREYTFNPTDDHSGSPDDLGE